MSFLVLHFALPWRVHSCRPEIESATGFKSCEPWTVDLADFSSVTRFVGKFQQECSRLDILVMNAGIVSWGYEESVDGWESRSGFLFG